MSGIELGAVLLALARQAIGQALGLPTPAQDGTTLPPTTRSALQAPAATFVTLTQHGQLRGCIGTLEAWRTLEADVQANAVAAALHDPRFAPLSAAEWPQTEVEVSLLSTPQAMHFHDEADALTQLRPGTDGVILTCGRHRSTFLPQVWEQLPERTHFMTRLKEKAGLPGGFWSPDLRLQRYTVTHWRELP